MTVAAFYDEQAVHGRAVMMGTAEQPHEWIVRVTNRDGGVSYWHCACSCGEIRRVEPGVEVSALPGLMNLGGRPTGPRKPLLSEHVKMSVSAYLR